MNVVRQNRKEMIEMVKLIWQICWPVLAYGLMTDLSSALCKSKETLFSTFAGACLTVPVFGRLYKNMWENASDTGLKWAVGKENAPGRQVRFEIKDGLFCIAIGIGASVAVNTLIMFSPLPEYFPGFSRMAHKLYGPSLLLQAGAMGVVIPWAEELVFRGLVFGGLRKEHPFALSAWLSAAVFGMYHGNVLQGIYGGAMGVVLAWGMEKEGTIKAPVLMHMAANLASVVLTNAA